MKRRLTKLVVFLLLGAVVNVAVAWGFVLGVPLANRPGDILSTDIAPGEREVRFVQRMSGRTRINWITQESEPDGLPTGFWRTDDARAGSCDLAGWPRRGLSCSNHSEWIILWNGAGTSRTHPDQRNRMIDGGFKLSPEYQTWLSTRLRLSIWRALPFRPIWPGFAINTIFYAAILGMLWLSPFVVRRVIRRNRGRCIKCGYDLRGDFSAGCPECGWRREAVV